VWTICKMTEAQFGQHWIGKVMRAECTASPMQFTSNQQALNLVLMVRVQQDVRAPSRARGGRVGELRQLRFGYVLRSFGGAHAGTLS